MTYTSVFNRSEWAGKDGQNANAECNALDENCPWDGVFQVTLREATRAAEDHALWSRHPVIVERTLYRVIEFRGQA